MCSWIKSDSKGIKVVYEHEKEKEFMSVILKAQDATIVVGKQMEFTE